MNDQIVKVPTPENSSTYKIAFTIYILYLASIIIGPLVLIGIVLAYVFENDAVTFLQSHYRYLIRSFWIGLLYFIIAGASLVIGIGIILLPLAFLWWIIRLVKGINDLLKRRPIENPQRWLF